MVAKLSLVECMAAVEDPRFDRTKSHDLQNILVLSVLSVLCGADGFAINMLSLETSKESTRK